MSLLMEEVLGPGGGALSAASRRGAPAGYGWSGRRSHRGIRPSGGGSSGRISCRWGQAGGPLGCIPDLGRLWADHGGRHARRDRRYRAGDRELGSLADGRTAGRDHRRSTGFPRSETLTVNAATAAACRPLSPHALSLGVEGRTVEAAGGAALADDLDFETVLGGGEFLRHIAERQRLPDAVAVAA